MNIAINPLEQEIIGLALSIPKRALPDMGNVRPEHFQCVQAGAVWRLITQMDTAGERIDPMTVWGQIKRIPKLERTGVDLPWLLGCTSTVISHVVAESRAAQLINEAELADLRLGVIRAKQILDESTDAVEAAELIRAEIDTTAPSRQVGALLADGLPHTVRSLHEETPVTPTPWTDLNRLISGWRPGALYVVGARPGVGKSILGLNAALDLAKRGPVAFNSLEMPAKELHQRMLAQATGINLARFGGVTGGKDPLGSSWDAVEVARDTLASLPLSVDDRAYVSVLDIRAHARSLARKQPLAGIVVDYLQLMGTPRGDRRPRHEIVAEMSRDLKLLAKELECPVIALSQLNRASESRQDKKPTLADLRESGAIEQDADVVLLLHMDEDDDGRPSDNLMNVLVAKNRHGKTGPLVLLRDGSTSTIRNYARPAYDRSRYGNF